MIVKTSTGLIHYIRTSDQEDDDIGPPQKRTRITLSSRIRDYLSGLRPKTSQEIAGALGIERVKEIHGHLRSLEKQGTVRRKITGEGPHLWEAVR